MTEEEIEKSPMATLDPPTVPEQPVPVIGLAPMQRMLDQCKGAGFRERRDTAILMLFYDGGLRLAEMTNLAGDDVDMDGRVTYVLGKGRRTRAVPFGVRTAQALDRYRRVRRRHAMGHLDAFWVGPRGAMTRSGIYQMVQQRAQDAGLGKIHPHQLRHTWAHEWLAGGGSEGDLRNLAGRRSRAMLDRYGASAAGQRAREAHRTFSPGDRL